MTRRSTTFAVLKNVLSEDERWGEGRAYLIHMWASALPIAAVLHAESVSPRESCVRVLAALDESAACAWERGVCGETRKLRKMS